MQFKELFKYLKPSAIYEYEWERSDEQEVFCTIYKWYMKSILINKSFYNILEYEEPKGLKLLQEVMERKAKDQVIDDIWEMSKHEVMEYFNPKFDRTTGKYIRKQGLSEKIRDIELPEFVLNQIETVQDGVPFIGLGKAIVPVEGRMIDFGKAKDLSKLTRKQITDKKGHVRTVWVKTHKEEKKDKGYNLVKKEGDEYGTRFYIYNNGKKIGWIGGYESLGFYKIRQTEIDSEFRGSGIYQKVIQEIANQFPNGVRSDDFQTSSMLKNALKKMKNYNYNEEKEYHNILPEKSMQKAVTIQNPLIYLDMDGVLTWFSEAYKQAFDRDVFKDDSFTVNQFCLTEPRFFRTIPVLEKGKELYDRLIKKYQVIFLTTPMEGMDYCKSDKLEWLRENICENPTVIFSDNKADYAHSAHDILVDDMTHNLESFAEAGGTAIDFTKHTNDEIMDKIADTLNPQKEIKIIKEQIKNMQVNTSPTEKQKESGIYQKGRFVIKGIPVVIENPKGSVRWGIGENGRKWFNRMKSHYGYIQHKGEAIDGDKVDVFIGDNFSNNKVFVINQGKNNMFDEHKVMIGYPDINTAKESYLACYEKGWEKNIMSIIPTNTKKLKEFLKNGNMNEPFRG
jgi:5'(3')-deoxyribonucleotidase/predicted GNAT family acetyltransferase